MSGIRIVGTGSYVPELVVTNDDFSRFVETSDEWITTRTGIKRRHISVDEPTWVLGAKAAKAALENSGLTPQDIDLLIATTVTSDTYTPSLACLIGGELGFTGQAMDLNAACTGFVYALDAAQKYLSCGMKRVLIVSAERLSKFTNYKDRSTCVLLGDGAGACVVERSDKPFAAYLRSDGAGAKLLYAVSGATENPFAEKPVSMGEDFSYELGAMYMDGREVYKFAVKAMPEAVEQAAKAYGIGIEDIDLIIPHQANIRILQTAAKALGLPMERFAVNIEEYGNISSACIPLCLDGLHRSGKLTPGQKICLVGFGGGLTYGAALFEI